MFQAKVVFNRISGTLLGLEREQPRIPFLEASIEMFLPLPREAAQGGGRGGAQAAADALPDAPLLFRLRRGTGRPGVSRTPETAVTARRVSPGAHGERRGLGRGKSGSAGSD